MGPPFIVGVEYTVFAIHANTVRAKFESSDRQGMF